jgi:ribonuclease E
MEAAFVDIGRGRNAVLYSGEVDWDAAETGNQPRRIELALKTGDKVLVQVTKDPVGHKGARLTSQISLPGRYLVYVPGGAMNGISRKLPDTERARLKKILKEVLPESSGVIVRTAAEGATEDQLTRDVQRLTNQWEHISKQIESIQAPALLHSEPDLLVKIVRDVFNEDFSKMLIQGDDAHHTITKYLESVAPDLLDRVERYEGDQDPFDEFRVTEQIEKALDRKVWLPSGGSLVIDRTEAMTVVDVNTGKFVGSGGNLEETVTKNNLEAAEEIVRQLRLRDIGGIIVVDFIDMVLESNRDLVLRRLVECLSRDRTKHQVAEVTSLGLVQMTRKKLGLGLLETFSEPCEVCAGRGVIVHHDPVVKHRPTGGGGSSSSGRRTRGGSTPPAGGSNGTHVITEGVKSALAQIAASTIHHGEEAAVPAAPEVDEPVVERPKKARKKRSDAGTKAPKTEKDLLLDSVLNALPEPKAPGQGRARRRVTTAALTGTPVSHAPAED